jgi:serine/threonine protein kinase
MYFFQQLKLALNEIQILRKTNHRNIINLHGCTWIENQLIIFMDIMPCSVKTKISREPLNEHVALNYSLQTAKGLKYLHGLRPNETYVLKIATQRRILKYYRLFTHIMGSSEQGEKDSLYL